MELFFRSYMIWTPKQIEAPKDPGESSTLKRPVRKPLLSPSMTARKGCGTLPSFESGPWEC